VYLTAQEVAACLLLLLQHQHQFYSVLKRLCGPFLVFPSPAAGKAFSVQGVAGF